MKINLRMLSKKYIEIYGGDQRTIYNFFVSFFDFLGNSLFKNKDLKEEIKIKHLGYFSIKERQVSYDVIAKKKCSFKKKVLSMRPCSNSMVVKNRRENFSISSKFENDFFNSLIDAISFKIKSRTIASIIMYNMINLIKHECIDGNSLHVVNFGTFYPSEEKKYVRHSYLTKKTEEIIVPKKIKFKPSTKYNKKLNEKEV